MPIGQNTLLGLANRFVVRIDPSGRSLGSWAKVDGLEVEWEMPDYRSGEDWNYKWSFPANTKYPNVKLQRSAVKGETEDVKKWLEETSLTFKNHQITIILHDAHGDPVMEWTCEGAVPKKWGVQGFEAGTSKIALETLEFSHCGFLLDEKKLK